MSLTAGLESGVRLLSIDESIITMDSLGGRHSHTKISLCTSFDRLDVAAAAVAAFLLPGPSPTTMDRGVPRAVPIHLEAILEAIVESIDITCA